MWRYKKALEQAIQQYNMGLDSGEANADPQQTVIMLALLHQSELLEELIGRTSPL